MNWSHLCNGRFLLRFLLKRWYSRELRECVGAPGRVQVFERYLGGDLEDAQLVLVELLAQRGDGTRVRVASTHGRLELPHALLADGQLRPHLLVLQVQVERRSTWRKRLGEGRSGRTSTVDRRRESASSRVSFSIVSL